MLAALVAIRQEQALTPPQTFHLRCIHVEHGIRPAAESCGDAAFVRSLCAQFRIPCRVVSIKPGKIAAAARKRGIGIEAAARLYRRKAWFRYARQLESTVSRLPARILTAHTADDMRETVLMRILRGSGPVGLAAMPVSRGHLLRPLLSLSRRDVIAYLREKHISWREDATNTDIHFLRNRIRHRLIPLLDEHFPHWRNAITALAETQSLAAAFLQDEAARRIQWHPPAAPLAALSLAAPAEHFFAQPPIIREEALFQGINALGLSHSIKRANIRRFAAGSGAQLDPQNAVTGQQREGAPAGGRAAESIWNSSPEQTSEKNLNVRTKKDAWRPGQENTLESETNNRFRYADMPCGGCGGEFYKRFRQPARLRARPPSAGCLPKNAGKVVDLGRLYIRHEADAIVLAAKHDTAEYGFSLLIKAPGSYNLKGIAIEVVEAGSDERDFEAGDGAFEAFLPLLAHYREDSMALRAAHSGKRCVVRITPVPLNDGSIHV